MVKFARQLWQDDDGAIIAAEYLLLATVLIVGLIVGVASVRDAINTEFAELANTYLSLSQGYIISGQSGCCSATDGSQAIDTPALVPDVICTPPAFPVAPGAYPGAYPGGFDTLPCN